MQNIAYIDCQNVHLGIKTLGRIIDRGKFREYLTKKYKVSQAKMFLGYMDKYKDFYAKLEGLGYELIFRKVADNKVVKGNIDSHLVMQAIIDHYEGKIDTFFLVSGDGDFDVLVDFFKKHNKFGKLLLPNAKKGSRLLKQSAGSGFIQDIKDLQNIVSS